MLTRRTGRARHANVLVTAACAVFLFEVYPYKLPIAPAAYQVSRLDRFIANYQRDSSEPHVVLHFPIKPTHLICCRRDR